MPIESSTAHPSDAPSGETGAAPATKKPSKRALIIGSLVVGTVLAILLLGAAEIVLRMFRAAPKPGSKVLSNELGWDRFPATDPPIEATASSPTPPIRLLCIGDSFTHNTAWTRLLVEELNRRGIAVTGWEAGVEGYGQVQEAMKLEKLLPELRPDIVVLLFFGWNDPRDNFPAPAITYNEHTMGRPYLAQDERVEPPSRLGMEIRDSELFRALLERWWFRRTLDRTRRAMRESGPDPLAANDDRHVAIYTDPKTWMPLYMPSKASSTYVEGAWRETKRALEWIRSQCAERKVDLVVAAVDAPFTIDRDVFDEHVAKDPMYRADDFDVDLPVKRFETLAESLGIASVSLVPAIRQLSRERGTKLYDGDPGNLTGHFLMEPQQVMASTLADAIEARVRSSRRSP
ncbi:MAG: SGNH/GDSL hydrolase family protein [Phycisphaerae bacterium]|nr:SGNH/GDSL hydrolase family protein [Phycisphaerae bacterium]